MQRKDCDSHYEGQAGRRVEEHIHEHQLEDTIKAP